MNGVAAMIQRPREGACASFLPLPTVPATAFPKGSAS